MNSPGKETSSLSSSPAEVYKLRPCEASSVEIYKTTHTLHVERTHSYSTRICGVNMEFWADIEKIFWPKQLWQKNATKPNQIFNEYLLYLPNLLD